MTDQLVKMCDELLNDWMNGSDKKSNKAWKKLLKDVDFEN